jgi:hypothetical protein
MSAALALEKGWTTFIGWVAAAFWVVDSGADPVHRVRAVQVLAFDLQRARSGRPDGHSSVAVAASVPANLVAAGLLLTLPQATPGVGLRGRGDADQAHKRHRSHLVGAS